MNNLENNIEALLFLKGEPMTIKQLAKILETNEEEIKNAVDFLGQKISDRGIRLVKKDNSFALATSPDSSKFTKTLIEEEFNSDLSKASLEVITIVAYKGPINRAEIDYIRGVNSSFTLRNLTIRGLVERIPNSKDNRSFLYRPSFQLLQYLGIKEIKELPEFQISGEKLDNFIKEKDDNETNNGDNLGI
jgi:segregation and condensation protein B